MKPEVSRSVTLATDRDTIAEALSFVLEAVDEVGDKVNIEIRHRIKPGDTHDQDTYYSVRVVGSTPYPQEQGTENE